MDKASIGGVLAGLGLVVAAILIASPLSTFINVPGILIVAGGTFAATSIAFPTNELKMIFSVARRVFNDLGDPDALGPDMAVAPNETAAGRAQNCRVEVFFSRADIIGAVQPWALTGEQVPELADAGGAETPGLGPVNGVPDFANTEGV